MSEEVEFTIHPLAENFPLMPEKEFEELKESIRKNGLFEPIVVNHGKILDGRHRYKALKALGIPLTRQSALWRNLPRGCTNEVAEERFIYDANIHRRHLTQTQIAAIWLSFPTLATVAKSSEALGKEVGVSGRLIRRVNAIKERAPERFEEVRAGQKQVRDIERVFKREDYDERVRKCAREEIKRRELNPPEPEVYIPPPPPATPQQIEARLRQSVENQFDEFVGITQFEISVPPETTRRWILEYLQRLNSSI